MACANAAAADVLVAIHFNAFEDPSVGGAETIYDDVRPFADRNLKLAKLVQASVVASFSAKGWQVPDRGVQTDAAAGTPALSGAGQAYGRLMELGPAQPGFVDHPSQMPGVVVEPLFLTRPAEAAVAADPTGQAAMVPSASWRSPTRRVASTSAWRKGGRAGSAWRATVTSATWNT